jgi:quinol-cytochrome oxidoreductase complex cytochrome b subunit
VAELRTWVWRVTVAFGVVLVVTGVWLSFFYEPTPLGTNEQQLMRVVHRSTSIAFPTLVLGLSVLRVLEHRRVWPVAAGAVVLAVGLSITGYLLPWDQLAIWAVTVGTDMRGMFPAAFDDQVRFVLVGGVEIGQDTIRRWFIVHAAVLPIAFAVCLVALRRRSSTVSPTGV